MPTLTDALQRATGLDAHDVEWLHLLVGDWQLVSDLSFADLVLWVRTAHADASDDSAWTVAAHVRPNTGPLVFFDDIVGLRAGGSRLDLIQCCLREQRIVADPESGWHRDPLLREGAIPVRRHGRTLAVITRHQNTATMRTPSRLELTYRGTADLLAHMISTGEFPTPGAPTAHRRGAPRVGDGVLCLDAEGIITYASPNATSALHRLGHAGEVVGESLSRLTTERLQSHSVVDESLPLVVTGRAPWHTDIESGGTSLSLRAIPLSREGVRIGALLLLRDVSELRRRERELLTKDATIREIHHRVKNNLQTVAALLRLQSRRVPDARAKAALGEAGRRIATIALVHDTLSRTLDEEVDFDEIVTRALNAVVEVATDGEKVSWILEGSFGRLGAEDATSVAMIVTELVQNAAEHGFAGRGGTVIVRAQRDPDDDRLVIEVRDDGIGLPSDFRPGSSGLGTQIVEALVQDLRGTITWSKASPSGTSVRFTSRLRGPRSGRLA